MHCRLPYSSRLYLPIEVGSGVAMCPTAPDLASLSRLALALPRVQWLQTLHPG
jgi:hypothetical protein